MFLSKRGNTIITKPIKGTAKRTENLFEDNRNKKHLQENLKEQNENVMIVDVCRNDLSRIAKKGSVTVPKLFDIESYLQVHQIDRKSTRLNSSHPRLSRMPSSA